MGGGNGKKDVNAKTLFLKTCQNTKQTSLNQNQQIFFAKSTDFAD